MKIPVQSSAKLSKSSTVGEHVIQVLNELPDHRWVKVATVLSECVLNSNMISPVFEDIIENLFDKIRWVFLSTRKLKIINIRTEPFGFRFCSLIENSELGIDDFNDFFSTFISLPDRIGNITQTAFPKFLRFLLKC